MRKLTLTVHGKTDLDIEKAVGVVKRLLSRDFHSGRNDHSRCRFTFRVIGEEEKEDDDATPAVAYAPTAYWKPAETPSAVAVQPTVAANMEPSAVVFRCTNQLCNGTFTPTFDSPIPTGQTSEGFGPICPLCNHLLSSATLTYKVKGETTDA